MLSPQNKYIVVGCPLGVPISYYFQIHDISKVPKGVIMNLKPCMSCMSLMYTFSTTITGNDDDVLYNAISFITVKHGRK